MPLISALSAIHLALFICPFCLYLSVLSFFCLSCLSFGKLFSIFRVFCFSVWLTVCLFVCLSMYLPIPLLVCLTYCQSICLSLDNLSFLIVFLHYKTIPYWHYLPIPNSLIHSQLYDDELKTKNSHSLMVCASYCWPVIIGEKMSRIFNFCIGHPQKSVS